MIGDTCTICALPIQEGQFELRVPHADGRETSIHGVCPKGRVGE